MKYRVLTLAALPDEKASRILNEHAAADWRVVAMGSDRNGALTVIMARGEQYSEPPKAPRP